MNAKSELENIKQTLMTTITEMDRIADGLAFEFKGINAEKCADYLHKLALGYRKALRELDKVDVVELME